MTYEIQHFETLIYGLKILLIAFIAYMLFYNILETYIRTLYDEILIYGAKNGIF